MSGDFKIIFQDKVFDPYFNLAAEDYLLQKQKQNFKSNILFIYRNEPSIVCGKNQSIWAEANLKYCRENEISANKRVSGGGTVYHDLGNINLAFFTPRKSEWVSNFSVFNAPIIDFLNSKGINAHSNDRNDILIENLKISGNAQHLSGDQMISHATLLFNADLKNVSSALKHPFSSVVSAAIQSKKVPVTNISKYGLSISTEEFIDLLIQDLKKRLKAELILGFENESEAEINNIAKSKYSKNEWVYGNSPKTKIELDLMFEERKYKVILELQKGKVETIEIGPENKKLEVIINDFLLDELFTFTTLQIKIAAKAKTQKTILNQILSNLNL